MVHHADIEEGNGMANGNRPRTPTATRTVLLASGLNVAATLAVGTAFAFVIQGQMRTDAALRENGILLDAASTGMVDARAQIEDATEAIEALVSERSD